jgi:hypothetical protein
LGCDILLVSEVRAFSLNNEKIGNAIGHTARKKNGAEKNHHPGLKRGVGQEEAENG